MKQVDGFPRVKAKFWKNGRIVVMYGTTKTKRLYNRIRQGKFLKVYIKVEYGLRKTNKGKTEMFYNDGTYESREEAYKALTAFLND